LQKVEVVDGVGMIKKVCLLLPFLSHIPRAKELLERRADLPGQQLWETKNNTWAKRARSQGYFIYL
jgi:hypothetical protein